MTPTSHSSTHSHSTIISHRGRRTARTLTGLLGICIATGALALGTAQPAQARLKVKELDVKHYDRGRPMIVVRVRDGRWQVTNDIVTLSLKVKAKVNTGHKITHIIVHFGGKRWHVYQGKDRTVKLGHIRRQWRADTLSGHPVSAGPGFCGNSVGKRRGTFTFVRKFTVYFAIQDNWGNVKNVQREIEGIYRCIY